ncbi:alpha/beta hydrolase fold domain-containing protein [Parvularcula dongshanensis]|uniref:Acetyl esterase/lipase n=1 Tax=Parvularcula dongshanensis TaxID=1173995 RepID=A0A840I3H9_9PROT|nr:acetyl esterase/lipase [Parvularcula dongshanensis]
MARILFLLLLLPGCSGLTLLNAVAPNPDRTVSRVSDLSYGEGDRRAYDLYVPSAPGPHPILVFFHGGSWASGDKDGYVFAGRRFAAEGFLTAVPNYTLVPDGAYPVFMQDAAAALAAVLREAPTRGGDPARVFLVGHSAGAYIAVQLALATEFLEAEDIDPARIGAVAGLSGPYDFLPLDPGAAQAAFGRAPDLEATQPVARVGAKAPPMLLLTGTGDKTVRPRNSAVLAEALRAAGAEAALRTYDGASHTDTIIAVAFPRRLPVVRDVTEFFASKGSQL